MNVSAKIIDFVDKSGKGNEKAKSLYAKVDDGQWYAIPPDMAETFRKSGAEVRLADELPQ